MTRKLAITQSHARYYARLATKLNCIVEVETARFTARFIPVALYIPWKPGESVALQTTVKNPPISE